MKRLAVCVALTVSAAALAAGPAATAEPSPGKRGTPARHHAPAKAANESARLARSILNTKGISYATAHVGGTDKASLPKQNLVDVSNGRLARTSPWGHKKGARVALDTKMLNGALKLGTQYRYRFQISELVGGEHSRTSKHYAGRAIDVTWINGRHVGKKADHKGFMKACRKLGASLVLGPGDDKNHKTHVHCQW
ncbi:hypothetical protein ACH4A8_38095 [Streptomyces vietnamensis]|uniref:hypothetical protein n=1 Tax=Streptomyces vietnamensis TaxID=362257 RepID=UPI00343E6EF3